MTRLSLNDLLPDTTYAIRIRAVGVTSVSEWSTRRLFNTTADTVSPSIPSSVTWVSTGDSFHGEWNAVDTNVGGDSIVVTRYEVELMANGVTKVDSLAAATGSKVIYDLSLEANRALFGSLQGAIELRVRAVDNKNLKSAWSNSILATNARPSNVTNVTGVVGVDQITLKWDAVTDADLARYEVYVGNASNFTPAANNRVFSGLATTFSYTTATYAAHFFKVRAVDKFEQASLSDTTSAGLTPVNPFVVDSTPPAVPSALASTITNNPNGQGAKASVSWTLGSETDRSHIELSYKRASDSIWTSVLLGKDQVSTIIDLASAYTAYDFRVRATDFSANTSAFSSTLSKPAVVPGAPAAVTGFGSTAGKDSIVYKWNANTEGDIKNYEVTFSTTSDFSAGNITYFTGTANSLTVSGLNTDTPYYARVRATNQNNQSSAFSGTNSATTGVYPTNTGPAGRGIASSSITYQVHNNGTTAPTGTWLSNPPATTTGQFLWTRIVVTYTDTTTSTAYSIAAHGTRGSDGLDGADGSNGTNGRGISGTTVTYQVSASGTVAPNGTWTTAIPATSPGQFLWTRTVITYSDATTDTVYAIAAHGAAGSDGSDGNDGSNGRGVSSTTVNYQVSNSGTTAPTGTWLSTVPATAAGQFLWTRTVTNYTDALNPTTAYSVAAHGTPGQDGGDGVGIASTAVTYQVGSSGTTAPVGTWTTSVPATTTGQFLWTRTVITFTDATTSPAVYSVSAHGATGSSGRGVSSTTVNYQASASGTTAPTGTWTATVPSVPAGQFLWTRTVITYTDSTTSAPAYSVALMGTNGSNGTNGTNGTNGRGISSTSVTYQTHSNGTTAPTGAWSASPTATVPGQFLWTRTVITYTDATTDTVYAIAAHGAAGSDGQDGTDGSNGAAGRGVSGTTVSYQVHSNGTTAPTGTWLTTIPATSPGQFLWTRTVTTYTDALNPTTAYSVAAHGTSGQDGGDGVGISSTSVTYQVGSSGTSAPTGTWLSTVPATTTGQFLWTRTIITFTDNGTSPAAYSVSAHGAAGSNGSNGAAGRGIASTVINYQASSSGTVTPTGTWLTTIPTVSPGQFLWTRTVVNYTDALNPTTSYAVAGTGTNGSQGTSITSMIPYFAQVATGATPANPSGVTPAAPWTSTEPTYAPNTELFRSERILFSNSATPTYTSVQKVSSYAAATAAVASSNGVNRNFWSLAVASGTSLNGRNFVDGDTWWQRDGAGKVIAQWEYAGGTWYSRQVSHQMISSIDVGTATVIGKLKAGNIDVSTGGDNLVRDSGFEGGTALVESYSGSAGFGATTADFYRGTKSLTVTPGAVPRGIIVWSQPMEAQYEIPVGEFVIGSFMFKGVLNAQYSVSFRARSAASSYTGEGFGGLSVTGTGNWQRIVTTSYAHTAKWIPGIQVVQQSGTSTSPFFMDMVKIEVGDIASPYSPRSDEVLPGTIKGEYLEANTSLVNILNIGTGGFIQSAGYNPAGTTGFRLSGTELTIKSGVITADAVRSGNLGGPAGTNSVIQITAGTSLIMNGGYIKSNTNAGSTMATAVSSGSGFYLGNDGLFIGGGANGGQVKVDALISGSLAGHTLTLATGGAINFTGTGQITATGFILNAAGLTLSGGASIQGAASIAGEAIKTGEIKSQTTATVNGVTQPVWSINTGGYARFTGMNILGNTVLGNGPTDSQSFIQSSNFQTGKTGWIIRADGTAEFRNIGADAINVESIGGGTLNSEINLADGASLAANGLMGEKVSLSGAGFIVRGPQDIPVSNKAATTTTVTLTTSVAHGLAVGAKIQVRLDDARFDGSYFVATAPTTTTLTYLRSNSAAVSSTAVPIGSGSVQGKSSNVAIPAGPTYVNFPSDGARPNIISGELTATNLTVSNGMTIRNTSTLERGATLTINSTIQPPAQPPAVDSGYSEFTVMTESSPLTNVVDVAENSAGQILSLSSTGNNSNPFIVTLSGPTGVHLSTTTLAHPSPGVTNIVTPNSIVWANVSGVGERIYISTFEYNSSAEIAREVVYVYNSSYGYLGSFMFASRSFGGPNALSQSWRIGWDYIYNTLIYAYRPQSSSNVTVRESILNASGVPTGLDETITLSGTANNSQIGFIGRGTFDFGVDRIVFKTVEYNSTLLSGKQYHVFTNTGVSSPTYNWPVANNSNIAGAFWSGKFRDVTRANGNVRTYYGSDSYWVGSTMTTPRYVRYAWYRSGTGSTTLSPVGKVDLIKRARVEATIAPIPFSSTGSATPNQATLYEFKGDTDPFPTVTNYVLKDIVSYPAIASQFVPGISPIGPAAPTANDFASTTGNPAAIQSATGLSYWRGDDTAQFKQLKVVLDAQTPSYGVMSADVSGATLESWSSPGVRGGFEIMSNYTRLNVLGGKVLIDSDTNIQARLASGGTALILAGFGAAIAEPTYNSSNPNATNTRSLHVNTLYAYADVRASTGLFDLSYVGGGLTSANINLNGRVIRPTSSIRYKKNVYNLPLDKAKRALDLRSVSFQWKDAETMGTQRVPGFIAEEAAEAGMDYWIQYGPDGEVDGFRYPELTVAHNALLKDLYEKNEVLENEVSELSRKLAELESLVNSMVNSTN